MHITWAPALKRKYLPNLYKLKRWLSSRIFHRVDQESATFSLSRAALTIHIFVEGRKNVSIML
jgi:hypothetical protein